MTLAEAMEREKAMEARLEDLRGRLLNAALATVEGRGDGEDVHCLVSQIDVALSYLAALRIWITKTHAQAVCPDGATILESTARRDALAVRQAILVSTAVAVTAAAGPSSSRADHPSAQAFLRELWEKAARTRQEKEAVEGAIAATARATELCE